MHNAPIAVPLTIGGFIFTFTEIAVSCTRRNISNGITRVRFSVRFETPQLWISVNGAFPALHVTGYIQYIKCCAVLQNHNNNGFV